MHAPNPVILFAKVCGCIWIPMWHSGKEICLPIQEMQETGFDPWVRKIPWRRKWQPIPSILAWEVPWTGEPDRLQSMGSQKVRHDWTCRLICLWLICLLYDLFDYSITEEDTHTHPQSSSTLKSPKCHKISVYEYCINLGHRGGREHLNAF